MTNLIIETWGEKICQHSDSVLNFLKEKPERTQRILESTLDKIRWELLKTQPLQEKGRYFYHSGNNQSVELADIDPNLIDKILSWDEISITTDYTRSYVISVVSKTWTQMQDIDTLKNPLLEYCKIPEQGKLGQFLSSFKKSDQRWSQDDFLSILGLSVYERTSSLSDDKVSQDIFWKYEDFERYEDVKRTMEESGLSRNIVVKNMLLLFCKKNDFLDASQDQILELLNESVVVPWQETRRVICLALRTNIFNQSDLIEKWFLTSDDKNQIISWIEMSLLIPFQQLWWAIKNMMEKKILLPDDKDQIFDWMERWISVPWQSLLESKVNWKIFAYSVK